MLWSLLVLNVGTIASVWIVAAIDTDCPQPCDWGGFFIAFLLEVDAFVLFAWLVLMGFRFLRRILVSRASP